MSILDSTFKETDNMISDAQKPNVEKETVGTAGHKNVLISKIELACLKKQLNEARTRAANAYNFAFAAHGAIQRWRKDLKQHILQHEQAALQARTEVESLARTAQTLLADELAAERVFHHAQLDLRNLLRHEKRAIVPQDGLRDILALRGARRWRHKAKNYATLINNMEQALTAAEDAQQRYNQVRQSAKLAEQIAISKEPKASELESAVVVLCGQMEIADEILLTLPTDLLVSDDDYRNSEYERWIALYDTINDTDRRAIRARIMRFLYQPLISIIVPVYNTPAVFLKAMVESVQAQLYEHWELCIADDASSDASVVALLETLVTADSRIKLVKRATNGHISAASNSALALATGEFIALLDHDDILAEQALFEIVACLNVNAEYDIIYSDEDHIDQAGIRNTPYFKSDYNHELMLGHNLINHFAVYRRKLVEQVGGFRLGFEGSQDYDLALRVIDVSKPERIHHIQSVLYHWRSNGAEQTFSEAYQERCLQAARRALSDHLARRGQVGTVLPHPTIPVWHRVKRALPDPAPLVSIIVPTRDGAHVLGPCVRGLIDRTTYPNMEIIIVDHQSTDPTTLKLIVDLAQDKRVHVMPYAGVFNYSAINNAAVRQTKGEILVFLNNDIDVINPEWLDEMVSLAVLPGVGAVGAKLLYPDGRVQHGGVILGPGGVAGHLFHLLNQHEPGYFGRAVLTSTVSAITAACLVVRKDIFLEVLGFDENNLAVAFNDVDLCLKIKEKGYRNVWTPYALLFHHESISRGSDEAPERVKRFQSEIEFMIYKWGETLENDLFYNPNLNIATADFTLSFPPQRKKAWQRTLAP
jgi:glycosyltransferase involved in cell wall biosynthesis